jgi:CDP-diglyceride synthetase
LKTRIIVSTSLISALAIACWIDTTLERGIVTSCLIVLLGMGALFEWNRFFSGTGRTYSVLLYAAGLAYPLLEGARILFEWNAPWFDTVFIAGFLIALYVQAILAGHVADGLDRVARTLLGFMTIWLFYRVVPILLLNDSGGGLAATYLLALTSKSCDMGAYLTGKLIGRRKLIPRVSPGKTVAGGVGGMVLSITVGVAAMALLGRGAFPFGLVFGCLVGLATLFGDLAESVIKRCVGVKDSGDLLPAQGGFLDMIDSLILAAPVGYVLLILF